jgi:hypothetical protein
MNVNNFFRFIGEKFPQYKLSSDNENLRNNFFESYEKDVIDQNIDNDNVVSIYFAVENESTMDENGKNGKFVQYSAEAELYRDSEGDRDIDFRHYKHIIDFKNDVKEGNDELYEITNPASPKKLTTTEYENGKKTKRIRFRYFYENRKRINGPHIDNITYYDSNGDEYAVDFYRFVSNDELGVRTASPGSLGVQVGTSELSYRKFYKKAPIINKLTGNPVNVILRQGSASIKNGTEDVSKAIIYFDTQGNEIPKEEWDALVKKL